MHNHCTTVGGGREEGGRTSRVKSLTRKNVVESTGLCKAERAREIYCTLQPGKYVVLVGTYVAEMDGPFRVSVLSNYECELGQIWPPSWRADREPETFAGKMALLGAKKLARAAEGVGQGLESVKAGVGEAGGLFGDDGELEEEEDEEIVEMRKMDEERNAKLKKEAEDKAKADVYKSMGHG